MHEMKIDAFNSSNVENGELPKTLCPFIFPVSFHEYREQLWEKNVDGGKAFLPKSDPIKA